MRTGTIITLACAKWIITPLTSRLVILSTLSTCIYRLNQSLNFVIIIIVVPVITKADYYVDSVYLWCLQSTSADLICSKQFYAFIKCFDFHLSCHANSGRLVQKGQTREPVVIFMKRDWRMIYYLSVFSILHDKQNVDIFTVSVFWE